MLLAPRVVVDVVLVVARLREAGLEEIGIDEHRRRRHEAAARVAPDAHAIDVDERVAPGELLDRGLLVGQPVVAQVAVAVRVVPLRAVRVAAAIADFNHDEPELRERDVLALRERLGHALGLRSRVNERDDWILLRRIEIERLVHHAIQIGHAIVGLHLERLWELEPRLERRREVGRLEVEERRAGGVDHHRLRHGVDARRGVHEVAARIAGADGV